MKNLYVCNLPEYWSQKKWMNIGAVRVAQKVAFHQNKNCQPGMPRSGWNMTQNNFRMKKYSTCDHVLWWFEDQRRVTDWLKPPGVSQNKNNRESFKQLNTTKQGEGVRGCYNESFSVLVHH